MVAIVTGGALGLNTGSGALLPNGMGVQGDARLGRGNERVYVNSATGNLVIQAQDEVVADRGLDLFALRTYNSQGLLSDDNGDNWLPGIARRVHSLTGTLNTAESTITRRGLDGGEAVFTWNAGKSAYLTTDGDGAHDTLTYEGATATWTFTDGSSQVVETYDASQGGRLATVKDADGNTMVVAYDAATGLVSSVTGSSGDVLYYDYNASRQLTQIRTAYKSDAAAAAPDRTLTRVRYTYDASNRLERVVVDLSPDDNSIADAKTYTTVYTYDGASQRVASITDGDGSTVSFTYVDGRVDTITDGLQRITRMSYSTAGGTGSTVNANAAVLSTTEMQTTTTTHALNTAPLTTTGGVASGVLINGLVKSSLSAAAGEYLVYTIDVPAGASVLQVQMDGGTGDADLYVRHAQAPTLDNWDYRSWDSEYTNESVSVSNPMAGTWYVAVYSYTAISGADLVAYLDRSTDGAVLQPGVAVTGIHTSAAPSGSTSANDLYYRFDVPAGATDVRIETKGLFGDADVYINDNAPADVDNNQFAFYSESGSSNEVITIGPRSEAVSWYIQVRPYTAIADMSLVGYYSLSGNTPPTINAGVDTYVDAGSAVTLSGTASDDGSIGSVTWTQISGPAVTLNGAATLAPSFTAPSVGTITPLSFRLTVTDNQGVISTDTVQVAVFPMTQVYVVQEGDTWSGIAQSLYGVGSSAAANALAQAMGSPLLTAGSSLSGLPSPLSVAISTSTTVPAYYTVVAGDTWTSITQSVYGTSDGAAVQALRNALNDAPLNAGAHLTVPATLTYGVGGTSGTTTITDALGNATSLQYDLAGRLTKVSAPPTAAGTTAQTVSFTYDASGDVASITDASGNTITYEYDSNGNQTLQRDAAGNTVSRTYGNQNQLLTETVYTVPDPDGTGVGQPEGATTTRYAYDSETHLRYVVSGEGRVTEYVYDTHGLQTAVLHYAGDFYPSASTVSKSALDTWRAGNGRVARADRQEFTYDWRGNLTRRYGHDSVGADRRASSVNGSYASGGTLAGSRYFVHDQAGRLLEWRDYSNSIASETFTYDGMGRVLTVVKQLPASGDVAAATATTLYVYDDAGGKVAVTLADGLQKVSVYNRAGELVSILETNGVTTLAQTQYFYDDVGRLRMTQDPTGVRSYVLYDNAGRKVADIEADGSLIEYSFNANNQVTRTLRYANALSAAAVAALVDGSGKPTGVQLGSAGTAVSATSIPRPASDPVRDIPGWNLYDSANRLFKTVDGAGHVVEWTYDGTGRVIRETRFADAVNLAAFASAPVAANATTPANAEDDRIVRYFYDGDGMQVATLDSEGYFSEATFDAAGRKFRSKRYGNVTPRTTTPTGSLDLWTAGTLDQIRQAQTASADDISEYFGYDARGQLRWTVDGDGWSTFYTYDQNGNLASTVRGPNKVNPGDYFEARSNLTLSFNARGTPAAGVWPSVVVLIDGVSIGSVTVASSASATYTLTVPSIVLGQAHVVDFAFANDAVVGSEDRNVWIDTAFTLGGFSWGGLHNAKIYDKGDGTAAFDGNTVTTNSGATGEIAMDSNGALRATLNAAVTLGQALSSTGAAHTERRTYDVHGRLISSVAADGTLTQYGYDAVGRLVVQTTAHGTTDARTTRFRLDQQGRLTAELGGEGSYALTQLGAAPTQAQIDAVWNSHALRHAYDSAGRRISTTDARGNKTVFYYDTDGRLTHTVDAEGGVAETVYNALGQVKERAAYTTRLAAEVRATLTGGLVDASLTSAVDGIRNPAIDSRTGRQYDARGHLASETDARGQLLATSQYNAFGQLKTRVEEIGDGRQLRSDVQYDRRGLKLWGITDPSGLNLRTGTEYDAFGRVTATIDARLNRTTIQYLKNDGTPDGGRKVVVTEPDAASRTTVYDFMDRVVSRIDGLNNAVRFVHDVANRKVTMVTAENIQTVTEYNLHGQTITVTDGAGAITRHTYDRRGLLLTTTDALGNVTQNVYDAAGNLDLTTTGLKDNPGAAPSDDGSAVVTRYVFDAANRRLAARVDPDGLNLTTSYQYDGQGRAVRVTDANGVVTSYNFNVRGELDDVVVDDVAGGLRLKTAYTYDRQGRKLTVIEGAGTAAATTTEYRYDIAGRRTHEIVDPAALNLTTVYEYDAAGNVVLRRDPLSQLTRYVYDVVGRLRYTVDAGMSVTRRDYDAQGRLERVNGYARLLSDVAIDISPAARTDAQIEAAVAALADARDQLTQYVYDKDGRLTYRVDAEGGVTRSRYDGAGRVVETRRYATPQPGAWTTTRVPVEDAAKDQITYTVYDAGGRARYSVDALDYVTESVYDRGGHVIASKRYAQTITRPAVMSETNMASAVAARLDAVNDRIEYFAYDAAGRQHFKVDAEGYVSEVQLDAMGRVTGTLSYANKLSFTTPPTLAQLNTAVKSVSTFDVDLNGFAGSAGIWEAGQLKLISQPEAGGSWAGIRSPRDLAPGASVKFDLTPTDLQPALHAGIDSRSGPYGRVVALLQPDGHVYVQTADAAGVWTGTDLGTYTPGTAYTVEITTGPSNVTVYFYAKGSSRESGYVHRVGKDLGWSTFSTVFYTQRYPSVGAASALVDNIEERTAAVSSNRYDAAGRLTHAVDAEGVVTRYVYDAQGRVTDTTVAFGLPEASTTHRVYDAVGRVIEETQAYGAAEASTTRYHYDAAGQLIAKIDPRGVAEASVAGLTAEQQNEILDQYTTRYGYDALGRRTSVTDALGGMTLTEYDAFDNAIKVTDPRLNSGYFYFDRLNRNTLYVDPEGFVSRNTYDAFGAKTGVTQFFNRAVGTWTTTTPPSVVTTVGTAPYVLTDAVRDSTVVLEFDRRGLLKTRTDAENIFGTSTKAYETHDYDAFGNRIGYRNKAGGVFAYEYDRRGLLVRETKPITTKSSSGATITVVDRNVYDARGNRVQLIEAEGAAEQRTTDFRVDLLGRMLETRGEAVTVYRPDTGYVQAVVPVTVDRYDPHGNLVSRTDPNGNRTAWYYDALNRKIGEVSATGTLSRFDYDRAGNVVSQRVYGDPVSLPAGTSVPSPVNAANVRETHFNYDANNREIEARMVGLDLGRYDEATGGYIGGAAYGLDKSVVAKKYDAAGNLVKLTDPNGGVTYTFYDRSGQKVLEVDPEGYGTAWVYGSNGVTTRQISYARPHTATIDEASDPATLIASWPADTADRITDYTYDRAFRLVTEERLSVAYGSVNANTGALSEATGTATQTYGYDGLNNKIREIDANGKQTDWLFDTTGRLSRQQLPQFVDYEGVSVRATTDYEYNGLNQVTRLIARGKDDTTETDDQVTRFVYGTGGRLLTHVDASDQATHFDYDAAGDVTLSRKDRKDADNVVVTEGSVHTYDASHRETSRQSVTMASTWQYGDKIETRYNAFGEITGKRTNGGNAAGEWQEFAEYNAMGKVVKTNSGSGIAKAYVYDAAGNATLSIESAGADFRSLTVEQILELNTNEIHRTFSLYDKRNQVVSVIQPRMDSSREVADVQQFVAQKVVSAPGGGGQIQALGTLLSTASTGSAPPPALTDAERFQPLSTQVNWSVDRDTGEGALGYAYTTIHSINVALSVPSIGARLGSWLRVRVRIDYDLGDGVAGAREAVTTDRNASNVLVNMNAVRVDGGDLNLNLNYTVTVTYEYDAAPAAKVAQGQFGGALAWISTELVSDGEGGYYPAVKQNFATSTALNGSFKTNDLTAFAAAASAAAISVYQDQVLTDTLTASVTRTIGPLAQNVVHWVDVTLPTPSFRQTFGAWQYVKVYVDYDLTGDAYGQRTAEATITDSNTSNVRVDINAGVTGNPPDFSYRVRVEYYWPSGNKAITLATSAMLTKQLTKNTENVASDPFTQSFTADTSNKTFFSGGSELVGADEVYLYYRTSASAPYTGMMLARAAGVLSDGSVNPSDPVPGVFYAWNSWIPSGIVDYKLVAIAAGTIKGSFDGTSIGSTTTLSSANRSEVGSIFFDSYPAIHFFDQATPRLAIQYRRSGSTDSWQQMEIGKYENNWFSWAWQASGLSGAYDMRILHLDSTGNVTARMFTQVNLSSTPTAGPLVPYSESDIVLTNQPANTAALIFKYWRVSSPSAVVERMFSNRGNGTFGRNFANDDLLPMVTSTSSYKYGYSYEAYDAGGQVVNVASGTFIVTPNVKEFLSHVSGRLPTIVPFAISDANALYMDIKYRPAGSTGAYTSVPRLSRGSNAVQFKWDASGITPATGSAAFEYEYRLFDASGNAVRNPVGEIIVVNGVATVGDSPTEIAKTGWVIKGLDSASRTIRRRQAYNAFGEVASETDGRGYATNLYYNTQGKLVRRLEPTTDVTGEDGVTTRANPDTRYYYDRAGRAIATRDANGFITSQAWTDGFTEAKVAKEFRSDGGQMVNGVDVFGNLRVSQDPLGRVSRYSYDKLNQLTRLDRPTRATGQYLAGQSAYETYEYDSNGNRIATTNVLGRSRTYYDIEGRVAKFTSIEGQSTSYAYTYENTIAGAGGKQVGGWVKTTTASGNKVAIERKDTFGRMTWRQDFGGHVFSYSYNHAGWLTWQTSILNNGTAGQNLSYEYYANGYLKRQTDNVYHTQADYTYDENGNRVFEGYKRNDLASVVYSNSVVTYDELNRVKKVVDPKYEITYRYDVVGNRRNVYSYYNDGLDGSKQEQDYWYLYDSMNRFTVTMGKLSNGVISRGDTGKLISYNTASERMSAEYKEASSGKTHRERYTYTSDGYLQDMFLSTSSDGSTFVEQTQAAATRDTDLAGRVLHYVERNADNAIRTNVTRTFDRDNRQLTQVDAAQLHDGRSRTDTYNYNSDGSLGSVVTTNVATGTTLSYAYEWWDSAKQTEIRIQAAGASAQDWAPGTSKLSYDLNGNLYRATDVGGKRTIQYVTDGEGQMLYRQELAARDGVASDWNATALEAVGGVAERKRNYYYLNGHRIGDVNNQDKAPSTTDYAEALAQAKNVSNDERNKRLRPTAYANFDENYQPINEAYPGTAPTEYTVVSGDTLGAIAARIWGDRAMWYLIAEANGLSGVEKLSEGMRLVIPNKVTNLHNNASTFKVYDAGEAIGDVSPILPPPPPPSNGCGTLGMVIMIVIAVVVTIYTAGAAAGLMSTTVAAGGTAATGTMAVGASVLAGTATGISAGTMVAAAAIGGAAGSIASQGFAMAAGMQDKFDWKQVGTSALGSAVTAGVGAASRGIQALKFLGQNTAWHAAGRAAVGSGISQGLQGKWNWRNITAAAVGGGAGAAMGDALGANGVLADLGNGLGSTGRHFVAGLTSGIGAQLAGPGGRMNFAVAFGNALGESLAEAASSPSHTQPSASASGGGASGGWDMEPTDYSLASAAGRVRFGTGSVEAQPTPEELQEAFRASEREYRQATEESVAGSSYRARAGNGISNIVGSSDPQAIGNFMRANNLTSDRIEVGRNYFVPESTTAYGDSTGLGQFALNQGNERIAAASRSETQRELNRFAAMGEASGGEPVWNMRDAYAAQKRQALEELQTRLRSEPQQYIGPIDDAANARAAMEQQRTANNLAAALGGPFVAAPMMTARVAGLDEYQVEQAGMLGLSALDAAGVKSGIAATRLASGSRARAFPMGFSQQNEFVAFGDSLYAGLEGAGFKNVQAGFQGSSVTGRAFRPPHSPFDVGRVSDYDIALSSPELFQQAQAVGIGLRQQGARTGPLMPEHLERLGLTGIGNQLSQQAGRPVNFMIYRSMDDAMGRSPTILVPRGPQ